MKIFKISFVLFTSLMLPLTAQEKLFTIEDVVINSYSVLAPSKLAKLKWIKGSNELSYVETRGSGEYLVGIRPDSPGVKDIISYEKLSGVLMNSGIKAGDKFPDYEWIDKENIRFWSNDRLVRFNVIEEKASLISRIPAKSKNRELAPNNRYAAFTIENNLFVSTDSSTQIQVTNDNDKGIVNGQSVHRNEFGITGGIFWSPGSRYLAFYRMDETMVTDYPLLDISTVPATAERIKYPMAGQTSHEVTIGIYEIATGETVWLKTGEPKDQYLTSLTWGPDEKYFYVAHLNRDQNRLKLIEYGVSDGRQTRVLFEETDEEFVEPETPLYFPPGSNDRFVWLSERSGWKHLYLYNTRGELLKQLTSGEWVVTKVLGFDETGNRLIIEGNRQSPIERHYYKVDMNGGEPVDITGEPGTHKINMNHTGNLFIDNFSSLSVPGETRILNSNGDILRVIHKSEDPLSGYKLGRREIFTLRSDGGTDLYCRITYPPDFDSSGKYPVIVYVYGGPHDMEVVNSYPRGKYDIWCYYMSQNGYILFSMDNRGTDLRGTDFEQATFRRLGTVEVADQMKGVEYLKSLEYVDPDRIGVYGWSYGGFMAASLMLRTNGIFKTGVSGGPVIDWKFYEVMYTERYMDSPIANPDGYQESSLLNYVKNLNGKLLLIHCVKDNIVVLQHTLAFVKKAAELNKPLDYFPYPGHGHHVLGRESVHLYNKISEYFFDNL